MNIKATVITRHNPSGEYIEPVSKNEFKSLQDSITPASGTLNADGTVSWSGSVAMPITMDTADTSGEYIYDIKHGPARTQVGRVCDPLSTASNKWTLKIPAGSSYADFGITFNSEFLVAPYLYLTARSTTDKLSNAITPMVNGATTTTGATVRVWRNDEDTSSDATFQLYWMAIGRSGTSSGSDPAKNYVTKGDVDTAVAAEKTAREAADTALQSAVNAKATAASVTAEATARAAADAELKSDLAELKDGGITPNMLYTESEYETETVVSLMEQYEHSYIRGYKDAGKNPSIIEDSSVSTICKKIDIANYDTITFDTPSSNQNASDYYISYWGDNGTDARCYFIKAISVNTLRNGTLPVWLSVEDGKITFDKQSFIENASSSTWMPPRMIKYLWICTESTNDIVSNVIGTYYKKPSDFKWLDMSHYDNCVDVILPSKIVGVIGTELNVYKDNALLYGDIDSVADVKFLDYPSGYYEDKKRFRCLPTSVRNTIPQFSVFLNDIKTADSVKNVNLRIVNNTVLSGLSKNILVIGDSKINGGRLSSELKTNLTNAGMTANMLGSIRSSAFNVTHEGRSGWASWDYTKQTTKTNFTNAFWDGSKFNFTYYMTQQGYDSVDYVFINLGTNDYAQDLNSLDYIDEFIANINTMISSIRTYSTTVPIIIGLAEGVCTYQRSSGADDYLNNLNTRARLLNKASIEEWDNRESEKLFICPVYLSMDMENDYIMSDVPLSQRDEKHNTGKTRKQVTDTMHQNAVGYGKNADYMYATICYIESI